MSDPLVRCGLVLAGANRCHAWGEIRGSDGYLTGLEAALLDLRGTRLVVLSACDTGVGDLRFGDGVAGLRQAFFLAGARQVMASLWQVPDEATAMLMARFFQHLSAGHGESQALRKAQLQAIDDRRGLHDQAHPYYWAAFTITGR